MTKVKLPPEFCSTNDVPVERATIKRERMVEILTEAYQAALASPEVQELRDALIESDNQLKQVLASNTDGLVHVVNDDFHLCLERNRVALASMEKQI